MKNLIHINNLVYNSPLLITKGGWQTIDKILKQHMTGDNMPMEPMDEDQYTMQITDNIAELYIQGPIGYHLGLLEKMSGACDINTLMEEIDMANTYPDVNTLIFHINSPGGSVESVPEAADLIAEVAKNKRCIALVDNMACSAAYFLAAGCNEIIAVGKTSNIGSIGCYCYLMDSSMAYQMEGVKPILIKSIDSPYKGEGMPGMPVSDEMKSNLQNEVDYINGLFVDHVKKNRKGINKEAFNGRCFMAAEALSLGLIDDIITSPKDLITNL